MMVDLWAAYLAVITDSRSGVKRVVETVVLKAAWTAVRKDGCLAALSVEKTAVSRAEKMGV